VKVIAVKAAVELGLSQQQAWAAVTDWEGQSRWMPLTVVTVVGGDGGLGTRLSARTGLGRLSFVDPMVIDVWEPPRRCEVEHLGRVVRGRGIFTVEELATGRCRVSWTEEVDGLAARATVAASRLALGWALRRFANDALRRVR
jgi:hypothetical protein